MQVQVGDLFRLQIGPAQRLAHCLLGATPRGLWCRNVVRIGAGATAEQGDRLAVTRLLAHQKQHRCFADVDAVAVHRERIAALSGHRFQR
ncbi:hypothetical protein D3C71_1804730 [compost metagenome]